MSCRGCKLTEPHFSWADCNWPDLVSNSGLLVFESEALPIAPRGPATQHKHERNAFRVKLSKTGLKYNSGALNFRFHFFPGNRLISTDDFTRVILGETLSIVSLGL